MFAHAKSRSHPADDDRVDEFPERSLDDDGNHLRTGHRHILRGRGVGHAQARTQGVRLGAGNLQNVHRLTDQPDFRSVLSQDIDFVLSVFYTCHFERFPGNYCKYCTDYTIRYHFACMLTIYYFILDSMSE